MAANEVTEQTALMMESVELSGDDTPSGLAKVPPSQRLSQSSQSSQKSHQSGQGQGGHISIPTKGSDTVTTSVFKNEGRVALYWLIFTITYWTLLEWIPTFINYSFETQGLTLWCIGAIGMLSCGYTLYERKYPSGATQDDPFETQSIGRYTAALLTASVITDVCVIVFYAAINEDDIEIWIAIRLGLHLVHIFWASLFFYNKFYSNHFKMATRAFFIEWTDLIWSAIICYTLNENLKENGGEAGAINYIYFLFCVLGLSGWMLPMMLLKDWGTQENARTVSLHLLILDVCTDIPVIVTLFAEEAYKSNAILFIDVVWKSFLIIRCISYYLVNHIFYRDTAKDEEEEAMRKWNKSPASQKKARFRAMATFSWIVWVSLYWTALTFTLVIMDNEIATKYQWYTWLMGMIGVFAVYDTFISGFYAMSARGRKVVAFACLFITTDWLLHAWEALYYKEDMEIVSYILMVCHAITVFWSILFFYGHALKVGRATHIFNMSWISLTTEWIDIMLMYIVILILHNILHGECFNLSLCVGYFVICSIKLFFWFFPIMFGYADTERYIHIHMLLLDLSTDLPLICVVIYDGGYELHWFIYLDIVYKILMLLRVIAYHGVINLILRRVELNALHKEQLKQSEKFKNDLENGDFGEDSDTELENERMITNDDHEADPLLL